MSFTPDVYEAIRQGAQRSAAVVVPMLRSIFDPVESVLDVGGGEGWWARAFMEGGSRVVLIDEQAMNAEEDHPSGGLLWTNAANLKDAHIFTAPFDLALCLEVAEHLAPEHAETLVTTLTTAAPVVVFSAAIPGQGGHGHLNEQWPHYWARRFAERGYECSDQLRWAIWNDDRVEHWYRQNLLVFGQRETLANYGLEVGAPRSVVHPRFYEARVDERDELLGIDTERRHAAIEASEH